MKHLSIFQLIFLCVFGALAVSGVLIFALVVGGNNANDAGPVEIWGTLDSKAFSNFIEQAGNSDPRLSQLTYVQKDQATYESDITNALANGAGPDLFLLRQDYALKNAGKIAPMPQSLSASQFHNTFIDAADPFFSSAGALGIPLFVDPLVLYWNGDMLGAAGFAKPPAYWEELPGMTQAITKKSDAGSIIKSAIAFGEYSNVPHAKEILSALILQAGGSITQIDDAKRLSAALVARSGSAQQATENALRFYTQFADPSNSVDYTWSRALPDASKAFAAGDLALYVGYASEGPSIISANPNLNFAVASLPQIKDGNNSVSTAVDTAHVYALAVSRGAKNQRGAIVIANLLASPDYAKSLSSGLGIPSALRDVLSQPAQGASDLFNKAAIISRSWRDPDPEKTSDIFRAMIERVSTGALRLSDAVARANEELSQVIGI